MRTVKEIINKLTDMKPTELKKLHIDQFSVIGDAFTFEEITGYFTNYLPLDRGNKKLHTSILSFSLLPVVTCKQECKGCYDIKSLRYRTVRAKRIVNTILASSKHKDELFLRIHHQLNRSRTVKAVRIHVGGDFFSLAYSNEWVSMANTHRHLTFYTYTKKSFATFPSFPSFLEKAGINVVRSLRPDGSFNFGPKERIIRIANAEKAFICPATLRKVPDQYCGKTCKACQKRSDVLFVIH